MQMYDVRVKSQAGTDTLKIRASSPDDVHSRVPSSYRVLSINKAKKSIFGRSLSRPDRIMLMRRLAMLKSSNVGIGKALDIVSRAFSGRISQVASDLAARVADGSELVPAMESMPEHFPPSTISLLKAGVHGGSLSKALKEAAEYEQKMYSVGRQATQGMAGTIFEFLLAAALIIGAGFFVGPMMLDSPMIKAAGDNVDIGWAFTLATVSASVMAIMIFVAATLLLISYVFKPLFPSFSDRFTLKVPVFRDIVLSKSYYSVFYGLSLLIKSGVRTKEALELSAQSISKGAIQGDLDRAAKAIDNGEEWAQQMLNISETDRACLEVSQDRNEIAEAFLAIAESNQEKYVMRIQQVVPTMKTLSTMFMTIAGVLIFAMTMMPAMQSLQAM